MSFSPSPEEQFLWKIAIDWRSPERVTVPDSLDWDRVAAAGVDNRMATLLRSCLQKTGLWEGIPDPARTVIGDSAERLAANAGRFSNDLREYLRIAKSRSLETVVLKGLAISANLYGEPAMRPGGDIDLLVRRSQVGHCIAALEEMGIGAYWPNLMADAYYERHHLHQQRSDPEWKTWFEIHWALDHPYTLLTVDYDAILDRAAPGTLLGEPVLEMTPEDTLLTLSIHLVKHAYYLPASLDRPDLGRLVLADGMLMYYLDVAELMQKYEAEFDWDWMVRLALDSGAGEMVGAVLAACRMLLGAAVPDRVLAALPVRRRGVISRRLIGSLTDQMVDQFLGRPRDRFFDFLTITNGAFILRPIRLLESAAYFVPPAGFLRRRYGESGIARRAAHFIRACGEFLRFSWDSVYFGLERYRRLRRIGFSTSLFNRLETEG